MVKLNYGSGENKLDGCINVDCEAKTKPDLICDLTKDSLPFENDSIDTIYCIHNIEHIEQHFWPHVFTEFRRVLKIDAPLILMYPEFEVCSRYFLENYKGMRAFWRACLYGRQLYDADYHVTPMVTSEVCNHLKMSGFHNIRYAPEDQEPQYTVLKALKAAELITKETLLRREVFHLT
jgi:Methyltransferase domain